MDAAHRTARGDRPIARGDIGGHDDRQWGRPVCSEGTLTHGLLLDRTQIVAGREGTTKGSSALKPIDQAALQAAVDATA
jgi:hypothetical protein